MGAKARSWTGRLITPALMAFSLAAGCVVDGAGGDRLLANVRPTGTGVSPNPSSTGQTNPNQMTGGVDTGKESSAPGATPSPSGTWVKPTTAPTPVPTPTPTDPPLQVYAISLSLTNAPLDKKLTLYAPAVGVAAHPDYPSSFQIIAQVTMSDSSNRQEVTWVVDPSTVATVSATGMLTALGPAGIATVSASTLDGNYRDSLQLTVKQEGGIEAEVE